MPPRLPARERSEVALRGCRVSGGRRTARRLGLGGAVRGVRARIRIEGGRPGAAAGSAGARGRRRRAIRRPPIRRWAGSRTSCAGGTRGSRPCPRPRSRRSPALRGRSRELHLLRHVRGELPSAPLVVEMGAGTSRTIAGLWAPAAHGLRYVATDISRPALLAGSRHPRPDRGVRAVRRRRVAGARGRGRRRRRARRPAPRLRLARRARARLPHRARRVASCCCTRR